MGTKLTILISFLVSFCSMSYEILLSKYLSDQTNSPVFAQSISIGVFFLGLAAGSGLSSRKNFKQSFLAFFKIELLLSALGALSPILMVFLHSLFYLTIREAFDLSNHSGLTLIVLSQPISFLIGFISGMEIPMIMSLSKISGSKNYSYTISASYIGGLFGGLSTPLVLAAHLTSLKGLIFISVLNLGAALLILPKLRPLSSPLKFSILLPTATILFSSFSLDHASQAYLKVKYVGIGITNYSFKTLTNLFHTIDSIAPIPSIPSNYQTIDFVKKDILYKHNLQNDFTLYLNGMPQFSRSSVDSYHQSMVTGAINLYGNVPKKVLILGGGDGLLLKELLKHKEIQDITLVELDPTMIEFGKTHPILRELNDSSLYNPNVSIQIEDAIRFIRKSQSSWDGVFLDFPYPVSYDLSKLYSREFYLSLKKKINPGGFFILDAPTQSEIDSTGIKELPNSPQKILYSTLWFSGFKNFLAFGPIDPFIYVSPGRKTALEFNYQDLPEDVSSKALINLLPLPQVNKQIRPDKNFINSIFWPKRFQWK